MGKKDRIIIGVCLGMLAWIGGWWLAAPLPEERGAPLLFFTLYTIFSGMAGGFLAHYAWPEWQALGEEERDV